MPSPGRAARGPGGNAALESAPGALLGRRRGGPPKLPASLERKRACVEPADRVLSVSQQCKLLGLSRLSYYYEPATESVENLALMALIDREYTAIRSCAAGD